MSGADDGRTHYEVIGVGAGASKEELREAYRARVGELRERADAPKGRDDEREVVRSETARLNAAWQVLSDPFQRRRYDEALGATSDPDGAAPVPVATEGDGEPARRQARRPGRSRNLSEPEAPPPGWPPGLRPPPPRARLIAMAIDLLVLSLLVFGAQLAGQQVIEAAYPDEVDRLDALADRIDEADERQDAAEERADNAEERAERARERGDDAAREEARADERAARADAQRAEDDGDDAEERARDVESDLFPARLAVTGAAFLLAMAYLVPPSARSGRTLGKRLLVIRAVRADGSPLGWGGSVVRYAPPLLLALVLSPVLGQLGFILALMGVVAWIWNRNRQGLHDRLAGTIVVDG